MNANEPCTVCNSTKSVSIFYGGLVCCSCKVFFLRSVNNHAKYRCALNGKCNIKTVPEGWVKCRWCRYQRCLQANMNPKSVGVVKEGRSSSQQDDLPSIPPSSCSSASSAQSPSMEPMSTMSSDFEHFEEDSSRDETHHQKTAARPVEAYLPMISLEDKTDVQRIISPITYIPNIDTVPGISIEDAQEGSSNVLPSDVEQSEGAIDTPSCSSDFTYVSHSDVAVIPHRKSNKRERTVVEYFKHGLARNTEHLTTSYLIGLSFVDSLRREGLGASAIAYQLCTLESLCDVGDQTAQNFQIKCNLDTPLETALANPLQLCERTPMGWQDVRIVSTSMEDTFRELYCRVLLHYLDWIHGLPEIETLSSRDKLSIVSGQMCQMGLLTMMWNTYKSNSRGLMFSSGYWFVRPDEASEDVKEIDKFLTILYNYMHDEVITEFRRLQMKEEEYVLLKAISFYNNMIQLSEEGVTIVRRARRKYEQTLVEYIRETYPYLTRGEQSLRAYQIIALNKHAMTLAMADTAYLNRMFTLNIGNMQGRMIYDMHVKIYGSQG